ncbi:hypothetical protein SLA2020_097650 [Shorea laevis]
MASNWKRNVRSFMGNAMGGLRGGANVASWVVAGSLAYFLWVKPSQDLKKEQQERLALAAASNRQETGLISVNKKRTEE